MNGFEQLHEYILSWTDAGQWQKSEEVVRCRDCKWLRVDMSDHEYRSGYWCGMGRFDPKLDGFCAWGEKVVDV